MAEREFFIGSFMCGVNIVQDIGISCGKVDMSMELLLGLVWLKSPARMKKASERAVCCSLMWWWSLFSASLPLLVKLGGMYIL